MAETEDFENRRQRAPSFPFISLKRAVDRVRDFNVQFDRYAVMVSEAVKAWGYEPKSSGGLQTIAALKAFGLMEDAGSGEARKVKLSELALRILHDERPGARERAIKDAALRPRLISDLWNHWGVRRLPDSACVSELTFERAFPPEAARKFLSIYDETIGFARLGEVDSAPEPTLQSESAEADRVAVDAGPSQDLRHAPLGPAMGAPFASGGREERLLDVNGQEIVIWFAAEPTLEKYEFLRDYLEFKIKRLAKKGLPEG